MKLRTTALLALSLFAGSAAAAETLYGATSVSSNAYSSYYSAENLVNQSGLSSNYISGVTQLADFSATHLGSSTSNTGFFANSPAFAIFDLGTTLSLTKLALWNDQDYQALKDFNVLISDSTDFSSATSLGSFSASYVSTDYGTPTAMQIFDLTDATGRYVKFNFLSAHMGSYVNLGEVAFVGGSAEVPVPGSLALLGLGLAGLGFARRRA